MEGDPRHLEPTHPSPPADGAVTARSDADDLPVVARLMVEIRSDGRRTVARGALEDLTTGQRTDLRASGGSPAALAASLARRLLSARTLVSRIARALLPAKKNADR